jgi:opacity protein-like surface antigen
MNRTIVNLIYIILFLFAAGQTEAQSPDLAKPFRVGVGLGGSFTGYREETEAPINRYLNALTYSIDGNIEKGRFFHSFNISFFSGNAEMTIPYEGYSHKQYNASSGLMEYALDYRLWGNQTFPGYLGGAFRTAFYFTTVDDTEDTHSPTGYGLVSLDIHATQKWIINAKNTLTLSAGFPVFGYAVRPPYAMIDELWVKYFNEKTYIQFITLGKIISFHNYWAFFADLKYHYKINTWLSLYSGLGIGLSRINFHRPRTDAVCRLNAGIAFTF